MRAQLFRPLLWPLSKLYGVVTSLRNKFYDSGILPSYRSAISVISVGNITVGGTGKTPLCIWLIELLKRRGRRPVVLSRGYGAKINEPLIVSVDSDYHKVGDEPLLIAQSTGVPVVVSPDRRRGVKLIEAQNLGDVIILDDGLQHRALKRELDIITVNVGSDRAVEDFFAGELLPLGRFRENRSQALARAKLLVLSHRRPALVDLELERRMRHLVGSDISIIHSILIPGEVRAIGAQAEILSPRDIVALSGIANPEGFEFTLDSLGFSVVYSARFPDHHPFSLQELRSLVGTYPGVPLVCTPKDAVRIRALNTDLPVYELRSSIRITPEASIVQAVESVIREALSVAHPQ